MYDLPGVRWATDAWWAGLAAAFTAEGIRDVPDRLTIADPYHAPWRDPHLLFTQTCGYPLTHAFARDLQPLAAIRWAIPGCTGTDYFSPIIVRADSPARELADLRGSRCAFNSHDSQSGYNALRHAVAPLARDGRFFAATIETGGHRASMQLVKDGKADVCAVDVATHALAGATMPGFLDGLRVLGRTAAAPGLPYATRAEAAADLVHRLRAGLVRAAADPSLGQARAALFIAGVEPIERMAYERIDAMEAEARRLGYPELA
jgi:ABC-type phosphate/phosphonate transport system substrate-binding protein